MNNDQFNGAKDQKPQKIIMETNNNQKKKD